MQAKYEEALVAINTVLSNPLVGALGRLREALPAAVEALERQEAAEARLNVVQAEVRGLEERVTALSQEAASAKAQVDAEVSAARVKAGQEIGAYEDRCKTEVARMAADFQKAKQRFEKEHAKLADLHEVAVKELSAVEKRLEKAKADLRSIRAGIEV